MSEDNRIGTIIKIDGDLALIKYFGNAACSWRLLSVFLPFSLPANGSADQKAV
jgi:hypothetical protein